MPIVNADNSQNPSASSQLGSEATNLCWLRAEAVSEGRVLCSKGALTSSAIPIVGTLSSSAYAWHCDNELEYRQTCERAQHAIRDQQAIAIDECQTGFTKALCVKGFVPIHSGCVSTILRCVLSEKPRTERGIESYVPCPKFSDN